MKLILQYPLTDFRTLVCDGSLQDSVYTFADCDALFMRTSGIYQGPGTMRRGFDTTPDAPSRSTDG